ncbi:hypothetical protein FKB36_08925 [Methanoculleus sp. Afa-1]|uniref:Uncharacterized protein n=1 Tax=Methanoculleus formosensis TaxID=2590886 RepID=A0A9E5DCU9_9EURY|nr:hypothetical protein [Methanoculleus sp. Afa-1]MCT8337602.1 hypothetical protein [Methanoculleus sp. Afa-1]
MRKISDFPVHRTFERVKVEIGRCDVCREKKAVYRSREAQAKVCEGCYARLVREWNKGEGCGEHVRYQAHPKTGDVR